MMEPTLQERLVGAFYGAAIGAALGIYFLFAPLSSHDPALWYALYLGWLGGVLRGGEVMAGLPILSLPAFLIYGAVSGAGLRVAAVVLAGLHYVSVYVALGVKISGNVRRVAGPGAIIDAFRDENSAASLFLNLMPFIAANILYFWAAFRSRYKRIR